MLEKFKVGDRVRLKYWEELPDITGNSSGVSWERECFDRDGGNIGTIVDISFLLIEVVFDDGNPMKCLNPEIDILAFKKCSNLPKHLFEIEE